MPNFHTLISARTAISGVLLLCLQCGPVCTATGAAEEPAKSTAASEKSAADGASAKATAVADAAPARATTAVTAVLEAQAAAWNRADLENFLSGYVQSPKISYVSSSGEVWGFDALRARYQSRYGDKHDTMGTLKFSDLKVQDLGKDNALCIGHWHLERADKPAISGIFSLVFARTRHGWKILHDHTSVSEPAPKS